MILSYNCYDIFTQNKSISKVSVEFEVVPVSYTWFIVPYYCIGQYNGIYECRHNGLYKFRKVYRQRNLQDMFYTNIIYAPNDFYWYKNHIKIWTFFFSFFCENGGRGCWSWNGPLNQSSYQHCISIIPVWNIKVIYSTEVYGFQLVWPLHYHQNHHSHHQCSN